MSGLPKYLFILGCIWPQLLNILLVYGVSLSLFPAVSAHIGSTDGLLSERYFTPVFCFLFFNVFAMVGNLTAQYIQWPGPRYLMIFTVARLGLIPMFLLCNYQLDDGWTRKWPVHLAHDWMFIAVMVLLAWSSGYLSSLAMMYIPRSVPSHLSSTAGMLGALTIILGILAGINSALIYPSLLFTK